MSNRGDNLNERIETKTGPDGRFVLHNLFDTLRPQGKSIRVWAKTMAPELVKVTTGPADQPAEVKVALSPGHRINGRVLDDKNQPLAGARVLAHHGADFGRVEPPDDQTTDSEGRFAFDSLPLKSSFNFSKRGYPQISKGPLPLDGETTVDVVLNPAGHIGGRVLDSATDAPVRSFNVRATFSRRRRDGDPSGGGYRSDLFDPGKAFVTTDGQFQIKDLSMGFPFQVIISAPGFEETVTERVVAVGPDDPHVEDFRLVPIDPANLENYAGRLIDATGAPVSGVEVCLIALRNLAPGEPSHEEDDPFNWSEIRQWGRNRHPMVTRFLPGVTDGQGRWAFGLVPKDGEVELAWWGPGVAPGRRKHLEKLDPTGKANVEARVFPPSAIVVTFDRRKYPTAAQVFIVNQDRDANDFQNRPTPTGDSGFDLKNIAAGTYRVSLRTSAPFNPKWSPEALRRETLATKEVTVAPGETARVEFKD